MSDVCQLTIRTRGAKLTKAVFGVSVDQLTGDREADSIRDAFHRLHGRWSSRLPKQQIVIYPKIYRIRLFKWPTLNLKMKVINEHRDL